MHVSKKEANATEQIKALLNGNELYAVLAATKSLNGNNELNVVVDATKHYKKGDMAKQLSYLKTGAETIFQFVSVLAEDNEQVKNLKYGAKAMLQLVGKIAEIKVSPDNIHLKTVIAEAKAGLEEQLRSADALSKKIGSPETVTQMLAKRNLLRS